MGFPNEVPEDTYTVILKNKDGEELARHTETLTVGMANKIRYTVEKTSSKPSYPLLSVASGLTIWLTKRRKNQSA